MRNELGFDATGLTDDEIEMATRIRGQRNANVNGHGAKSILNALPLLQAHCILAILASIVETTKQRLRRLGNIAKEVTFDEVKQVIWRLRITNNGGHVKAGGRHRKNRQISLLAVVRRAMVTRFVPTWTRKLLSRKYKRPVYKEVNYKLTHDKLPKLSAETEKQTARREERCVAWIKGGGDLVETKSRIPIPALPLDDLYACRYVGTSIRRSFRTMLGRGKLKCYFSLRADGSWTRGTRLLWQEYKEECLQQIAEHHLAVLADAERWISVCYGISSVELVFLRRYGEKNRDKSVDAVGIAEKNRSARIMPELELLPKNLADIQTITPRHTEIIAAIASGLTNHRAIAEAIGVSQPTVSKDIRELIEYNS